MNRILQLLLTIFLFSQSIYGQGTDTLAVSSDTLEGIASPATDTLPTTPATDTLPTTPSIDTLAVVEDADSIPLYVSGNILAEDSLMREMKKEHSPSKAIMYALVLPGLGQGYNQKYYKIPIVWAALGGAVYAISYNTGKYRDAAYEYALVPDDNNERILRGWRRYMELSYIALTFVYALQVVDAYVDAQLYSWDVNENLSMRVKPSLQPLMAPNSLTGQSYGFTCSFNLKGR